MALTITRLGTFEDGTPNIHYAGEHVVITGPAVGSVTVDGKQIDVSPAVVEADSPEHAAAIAHEIANLHVLYGHPTDETYVYTPPSTDVEGELQMLLAGAAAENAALNGLAGVGSTNTIPFVSLHTATPGTTGASEYAGVTRQSCSWNAASAGAMTNSTALTFTTSGASAVTHIGTWSLVSSGVYSIGAGLGSTVTATSITIASGAISLSAT